MRLIGQLTQYGTSEINTQNFVKIPDELEHKKG